MHRTQLYFDEDLFSEVKQAAGGLNMTVSAYIREVLRNELKQRRERALDTDFSDYVGMWKDQPVDQESLRKKAWK